jgi:hypothetical protein
MTTVASAPAGVPPLSDSFPLQRLVLLRRPVEVAQIDGRRPLVLDTGADGETERILVVVAVPASRYGKTSLAQGAIASLPPLSAVVPLPTGRPPYERMPADVQSAV